MEREDQPKCSVGLQGQRTAHRQDAGRSSERERCEHQREARHGAQVVITLAAGKGFSTASLASAQVSVRINNVRTHATANLATGIVTATEDKGYVTPMREGSVYKAIVVPQQLDKGHLITVTVDGTDFNLQKDPRLTAFEQGHRYQMTVTLSKTSGGMSVGIVNWSDDGVDYGGVAEPN